MASEDVQNTTPHPKSAPGHASGQVHVQKRKPNGYTPPAGTTTNKDITQHARRGGITQRGRSRGRPPNRPPH